jgi:Ca-activated chloride channel homolog
MSDWLDIRFWEYTYHHPERLWLLMLLPLVWLIATYQERLREGLKVSGFHPTGKTSVQVVSLLPYLSKLFFTLTLAFLVVAISKPYKPDEEEEFQKKFSEGIDIVLALDISTSMLARDFKPNRLEAAKKVAAEFIQNRPNDRIGLVVYEGEAFTKCPATTDHNLLLESLMKLEAGILRTNRTAIGMGLGLAVTRLRSDELRSKVIILMSDGENNAGDIDPLTAAELARAKNVRVYTIGIGSKGTAPMPVQTPFGVRYQQVPVSIDEDVLTEIADMTGGQYFRATDELKLGEIYQTIDQMEKTRVKVTEYRVEPPLKMMPFLLFGSLFMALGFLSHFVLLRQLV